MKIQQWFEANDYIDKFKKHNVQYRKYPDLELMIIKRRYGSEYSEKRNWLNYCRGLIINYKTNKIIFIPPTKAKECSTSEKIYELNNSPELLVDGIMINLFYYNNKWLLSTRSNIGATNTWSSDNSFQEMFKECSKILDYSTLNTEFTYSFVMRHKNNRLTSRVGKNELVLVEVYHKGVRQPSLPQNKGYTVVSQWTSEELFKGLTIKVNNIRYKWLTNEHKFIEMIKPNTENPCLNYLILRNSGNLTEYIKYFPEKRFEFNKYRKKLHTMSRLLYQLYSAVFIKKTIKKEEVPFHFKPLIYEVHGYYLKNKQGISWEYIKNYIYEIEPKRLYFVMNNL